MKFSSRRFFEQNDQKLVDSLKAKFGHDAVLRIIVLPSLPSSKAQESRNSMPWVTKVSQLLVPWEAETRVEMTLGSRSGSCLEFSQDLE
ncbi:hypothetical protein [Parasitella parasitica]|uniref:Uncharacterized protein n=1 Tax=Parasitella parasitica TaxID=35722 RepID=A0A0B7NDM9_9FUNG|nr:hypothetical protein [Parasitella parasitica]